MQSQNQDNADCSSPIPLLSQTQYRWFLSVGYGLFLTLINVAYATSMATVPNVYPSDIGDPEFSLISSFFIMICALGLVIYGLVRPTITLRNGALPAMIILIAIYICSACGLFAYIPTMLLTVLLAGVFGITVIIANIAWLVPFASLGTKHCLITLVIAFGISALLELILAQLPSMVCFIMVSIVGLFSVALFIGLQFRSHATVGPVSSDETSAPVGTPSSRLRTLFPELWRPLLVYVSLALLSGLVAVFIGETASESVAVIFRSLAPVAAVVIVACITGLTARTLNVRPIFLSSFPLIALVLAAFPFFGAVGGEVFRIALSFLCSIAVISMLFLLLETARERQAPVAAAIALCMFLVQLGLEIGSIAGLLIENISTFDRLVNALIFIIVAIYLLSFTLTLLSQHTEPLASKTLLSLAVPADDSDQEEAEAAGQETAEETPQPLDPFSSDVVERRSYELAARYHLTPREREVLVLLVRGRTAPYIASELNIATNTVRGYIQDIYAKLGIHSKQELINQVLYPSCPS